MRLRTFISPVFCRNKLLAPELTPVRFNQEELYWFDALLGGGILIPDSVKKGDERPLIWLVSGPPGTGKTIFSLELCHHLTSKCQEGEEHPLFACYYSAESPVSVLKENLCSFGWPAFRGDHFNIIGEDKLRHVGTWDDLFKKLPHTVVAPKDHDQRFYHVIVIDSLNVLGTQIHNRDPFHVLKSIQDNLKGRCWIVILMQDWEHDHGHDPSFAFVADIETRLSVKERRGYLLHYLRVVKMRNQEHARGEQLLKIYARPINPNRALNDTDSLHHPASDQIGIERNSGGIFIFPSIHRHLSSLGAGTPSVKCITTATRYISEEDILHPPVTGLDQLTPLGMAADNKPIGGFPKGCCTAFLGDRGAMKSHLAYLTLLKNLECDKKASGVMLSLRDNVSAAEFTLQQLCLQENMDASLVCKLREENRLDIVYFAPGYLPPEEFMHRVFVAIEGMIQRHGNKDGEHIIAVLNGLDHLAARHPLCAEESMFVPALVSYLNKRNVSSFVVTATDDPFTADNSGIMPMAEMLIRFESIVAENCKGELAGRQATKLIAQRVPAGATGGGWGFLVRDQKTGSMQFMLGHATGI